MDEADTYLKFAGRADPFQWFPAANNHMLNTALIRLFTSIFGLSQLTLRLPALIGAAIYIGACLYLCRLVSDRVAITVPLFVCLVYNPFVFDFLVLARGYGMASGFLVCAIAAAASVAFRNVSAPKAMAACSLFAALSFCSNFSFALANLAVLACAFIWIARTNGFSARLLAAAALPGALTTLLIPFPTILRWPAGQLFEGATSLRQSFGSVIHWSLTEVNPELANSFAAALLQRIEHRLFPLLGLVVMGSVATLLLRRKQNVSAVSSFAAMLGGALVLTTVLHWTAFHLFGLLLPFNRTALFYAPLGTLFAGALAVAPGESRAHRAAGIACTGMLCLFAIYFLFCMRLSWSGEQRADAEVNKAYAELAPYNHRYCVESVGVNWLYSSVLNFYRVMSGRETFTEFQPGLPLPEDAPVYVINANFDRKFIEDHKLTIVYHGPISDIALAVRPDVLMPRDATGNCPAPIR